MTRFGLAHAALATELVPVLALALGALAAGRHRARRRARRLLGPTSARAGSGRADALLALACAALALALLGPRLGLRTERVPATGVDLVLLFDVSQSMRARDVPPSRLARARALAADVLLRLDPGDRAALAAFAGEAVLLTPLTPDRDALRELLPALDETLIAAGGSRLDRGVREAIRAFRPESARPRVLLVLSDGEDPERREALGLEAIAPLGARVIAAGFGSAAGAPVPVHGSPLLDASGHPVSSTADFGRLAALADPTGGALFRTDRFGTLDTAALVAAVRRDADTGTDGLVERRVPRSVVAWLAALALATLLAEIAVARRGASGGAPLAPATPRLRQRAQGIALGLGALLALGADPGEAPSEDLEARIREAPGDAYALLRLGVARAHEGALDEAERAFFAAAVRAREDRLAGDALFDLGVAAIGRGDLEAARDAFFDAIALAPGDRAAQWNLEWTLRALAERPPAERGERDADPSQRQRPEDDPGDRGAPQPESQSDRERSREEPQPDPAASRPVREGEPTRVNPVSLDPEAAKRWLESVADDPGRALQAAARGGKRRTVKPSGVLLW